MDRFKSPRVSNALAWLLLAPVAFGPGAAAIEPRLMPPEPTQARLAPSLLPLVDSEPNMLADDISGASTAEASLNRKGPETTNAVSEAPPLNAGGEPRRKRGKHVTEIRVQLTLPSDDAPPSPAPTHFASYAACRPHCDCCQGFRYRRCDAALGFCHEPLYFEHVRAERLGVPGGPLGSLEAGAHFFGSIATLPYQVGITPPLSRIATWGANGGANGIDHHRQLPWTRKGLGVLTTGATVIGLLALP